MSNLRATSRTSSAGARTIVSWRSRTSGLARNGSRTAVLDGLSTGTGLKISRTSHIRPRTGGASARESAGMEGSMIKIPRRVGIALFAAVSVLAFGCPGSDTLTAPREARIPPATATPVPAAPAPAPAAHAVAGTPTATATPAFERMRTPTRTSRPLASSHASGLKSLQTPASHLYVVGAVVHRAWRRDSCQCRVGAARCNCFAISVECPDRPDVHEAPLHPGQEESPG